MKTADLNKHALNWAVATCEGYKYVRFQQLDWMQVFVSNKKHESYDFNPIKNWAQGGPIIEREGICLSCVDTMAEWDARIYEPDAEPWQADGPTPLIAAMRCYVASKLGDEVEIPEGLE